MADGFAREVYLVNGQQPGPLIEADEGDDVEIFVQNNLPVDTAIHWHGKTSCTLQSTGTSGWETAAHFQGTNTRTPGLLQRGTPNMDGVPGVTQVGVFLSQLSPC
jgi:FtsP/CotA-like multicopper oxidase with cupredoxin domain